MRKDVGGEVAAAVAGGGGDPGCGRAREVGTVGDLRDA